MAVARVPAGDGLEGRVRSRSCATGEAQAYKGSDGNILNGASGGFPRREGAAGAATSGTRSLKTAALMGREGKKKAVSVRFVEMRLERVERRSGTSCSNF